MINGSNFYRQDEDDDMDDTESYGDEDEMMGVSDVTNQLAAAGWQNGVHPFLLFIL